MWAHVTLAERNPVSLLHPLQSVFLAELSEKHAIFSSDTVDEDAVV